MPIRYQLETALQNPNGGASSTRVTYDTKEELATALTSAIDNVDLFYLHVTPINMPEVPEPPAPLEIPVDAKS